MPETKERSAIWYLVPIMFGLLGGIITYAAINDDNHDMAIECLFIGIFVTGLMLFLLLQ